MNHTKPEASLNKNILDIMFSLFIKNKVRVAKIKYIKNSAESSAS
jgi:hypothetical protein